MRTHQHIRFFAELRNRAKTLFRGSVYFSYKLRCGINKYRILFNIVSLYKDSKVPFNRKARGHGSLEKNLNS